LLARGNMARVAPALGTSVFVPVTIGLLSATVRRARRLLEARPTWDTLLGSGAGHEHDRNTGAHSCDGREAGWAPLLSAPQCLDMGPYPEIR
jgi:hypothetical protein